MKVKYYIKRPNAKKETAVYALINYDGNTVKIYTGETIVPKYWNPKTQSAKNTESFIEHPEFNQRLINIRSTISRVFYEFQNNNDHEAPAPAVLKPLIKTALKKGQVKFTFLSFFEDFVQRTFSGKRITPKGKIIGRGVAKGYQTTLNHLKEFSSKKRKIDFANIDLEFHTEFTEYLQSSPLLMSANTIGSHFQRIKAVLAEASEKGINSYQGFKSKYFVKQSEEADTIYLNEAELKEMQKLKLEDNPRLDNVRDLFLTGAYTGLRFGDYTILTSKNIADGFIRITQSKTGDPVVIPVHPVVKSILKKYNGSPPRAISNVKANSYLKELGKMITTLQKPETKTITKGGKTVVKTVQKWELLVTHTSRRSFATNEFKAGTPTITIMAITGHKTEKSFLKYIRVSPKEHAIKMKTLWDERNRRKHGKIVKFKTA